MVSISYGTDTTLHSCIPCDTKPRTMEALAFMGISDDVICASLGPNGYAFYGPDGHTARYAPWAEGVGNAQYYPFVSEKKNNLTQEKLLSLVLI